MATFFQNENSIRRVIIYYHFKISRISVCFVFTLSSVNIVNGLGSLSWCILTAFSLFGLNMSQRVRRLAGAGCSLTRSHDSVIFLGITRSDITMLGDALRFTIGFHVNPRTYCYVATSLPVTQLEMKSQCFGMLFHSSISPHPTHWVLVTERETLAGVPGEMVIIVPKSSRVDLFNS